MGHLAEAAWHHPDLTVSYAFVIVKLTESIRIDAPTEKARQLGQLIRSGASELHMAMPNLREKKNFRLVTEHIKEINTIENNGDRILREALVEIVARKDDIFNLIRWKEIYEMLEETTDTMEDVADVLQRVVIKNG